MSNSRTWAGCFCILAAAAFSQNTQGTISGTITGPEGGVFPFAWVHLKNTKTAATQEYICN